MNTNCTQLTEQCMETWERSTRHVVHSRSGSAPFNSSCCTIFSTSRFLIEQCVTNKQNVKQCFNKRQTDHLIDTKQSRDSGRTHLESAESPYRKCGAVVVVLYNV